MARRSSSFQAQPDRTQPADSDGQKVSHRRSSFADETARLEQARAQVGLPWPPAFIGGEPAPEWLGTPRGSFPPGPDVDPRLRSDS